MPRRRPLMPFLVGRQAARREPGHLFEATKRHATSFSRQRQTRWSQHIRLLRAGLAALDSDGDVPSVVWARLGRAHDVLKGIHGHDDSLSPLVDVAVIGNGLR